VENCKKSSKEDELIWR